MLKLPIRFSLLNLLLITAIVALAIGLAVERSRSSQALAEVERVRNLFGELTIQDKSQVHVISVPTGEAFHWRWRVYLPGGHDFGMYAYRGKLAAGKLPTLATSNRSRIGGQSDPKAPREVVIDVALGKSAEGAACVWVGENGQAGSPVTFDKTALPAWADGSAMQSEKIAGRNKTVSTMATTPLGLIAVDALVAPGVTSDDALLIWIGQYEKTGDQTFRDRGILP